MARKPDTRCSGCGKLIWSGSTSLPAGQAKCQPCRREGHGTKRAYTRGCRCDLCKSAVNEINKRYAAAYKERTGQSLRGKYRQSDGKRYFITPKVRREVYERDAWVCQLCFEPIAPDAPPNTSESASVDHIECQSWALVPDHSMSNLRMAHFGCNARRGNEMRSDNAIRG